MFVAWNTSHRKLSRTAWAGADDAMFKTPAAQAPRLGPKQETQSAPSKGPTTSATWPAVASADVVRESSSTRSSPACSDGVRGATGKKETRRRPSTVEERRRPVLLGRVLGDDGRDALDAAAEEHEAEGCVVFLRPVVDERRHAEDTERRPQNLREARDARRPPPIAPVGPGARPRR